MMETLTSLCFLTQVCVCSLYRHSQGGPRLAIPAVWIQTLAMHPELKCPLSLADLATLSSCYVTIRSCKACLDLYLWLKCCWSFNHRLLLPLVSCINSVYILACCVFIHMYVYAWHVSIQTELCSFLPMAGLLLQHHLRAYSYKSNCSVV